MPPSLERALLPFQREGVRYGLAHGGRCLIAVSRPAGGAAERSWAPSASAYSCWPGWGPSAAALSAAVQDEMGVGKTVQAIALASCYQVGAALW